MTIRANNWLDGIPAYIPGKHSAGHATPPIILSSNENPLGCSPLVQQALANFQNAHRYPDPSAMQLRHELGRIHNINPENIICTNGSDELLQLLARAFLSPNDSGVCSEYGFLMYPIAIKLTGAQLVKIPEIDYKTNLPGFTNAMNTRTKLAYLAYPNNPTGYLPPIYDMDQFIKSLPAHVVLVLDCAYSEFVADPHYHQKLSEWAHHPQIIIARTFSKIYGLASLRIGWAVGAPTIIQALHKVRGPFNTSAVAQAAALAALADREFLIESYNLAKQGIEYLTNELTAMQYHVLPSQANFILVDCGTEERANAFLEKCTANNIMIRGMQPYNLPHCVRISVGTMAENTALINIMKS